MAKKSVKAKVKKQRRLQAAAEEKAKKEVVQNAMYNDDKTVVCFVMAASQGWLHLHCTSF